MRLQRDSLPEHRCKVLPGERPLDLGREVAVDEALRRSCLRRDVRRLGVLRVVVLAGDGAVMLDEVVHAEVGEVEPAAVAPERLEGREELDGERRTEVCTSSVSPRVESSEARNSL